MSQDMSYKAFKVQHLEQGRIVKVTINRPKSLNSMNKQFFTEIQSIFKKINTDENARVAILVAEGRVFSAGLDLKQVASSFIQHKQDNVDIARSSIKLYNKLKLIQQHFVSLMQCRVPVLAGVHNLCLGGGIDLICMADIRYCTKDVQFTIKQIDIGMAADLGTLLMMPTLMGNQSTFRQLAYTGRFMGAEEAHKTGFVTKVFEDKAKLEQGLLETAKLIASKSPVGIYAIKSVLQRDLNYKLKKHLQQMARLNSAMLQTQDTIEAISAFMQKRPSQFPKL